MLVRLEDADQPLRLVVLPRRPQRDLDLRRVVGVVVHHGDPGAFALEGHPPVRAGEVAQVLGNLFPWHTRVVQQRHRGQRVVYVVPARQADAQTGVRLAPQQHIQAEPPAVARQVHAAPGAAFGEPEGFHLAGGGLGGAQGVAVLSVDHQHAFGRHLGREGPERLDDGGQILVAVEVVFLDVQNGRIVRAEVQEAAVELARLGYEVLAPAHAAGPVELLDRRADDETRIEARGAKHVRHHRRRRALAVRPRHRDAHRLRHQAPEHLAILDHVQPALPGGQQFGVLLVNSRRIHHQVALVRNVLRPLPDGDGRAVLDQANHRAAVGHLRAAHHRAASQQHARQRPHPGSANADQVDPPGQERLLPAGRSHGLLAFGLHTSPVPLIRGRHDSTPRTGRTTRAHPTVTFLLLSPCERQLL